MTEEKVDRRVQRTRELLQRAFIRLIFEKGYDSITIQDITDRANLGRTTFYLHYQSKEELFLDHHEALTADLKIGRQSRAELCNAEPPPNLANFLGLLEQNRNLYFAMKQSKEAQILFWKLQQQIANNLEISLNEAFGQQQPKIPLDALTMYIAGAQLGLIDWWIQTYTPASYSARRLAEMLHQLQYAALQKVFNLETD